MWRHVAIMTSSQWLYRPRVLALSPPHYCWARERANCFLEGAPCSLLSALCSPIVSSRSPPVLFTPNPLVLTPTRICRFSLYKPFYSLSLFRSKNQFTPNVHSAHFVVRPNLPWLNDEQSPDLYSRSHKLIWIIVTHAWFNSCYKYWECSVSRPPCTNLRNSISKLGWWIILICSYYYIHMVFFILYVCIELEANKKYKTRYHLPPLPPTTYYCVYF